MYGSYQKLLRVASCRFTAEFDFAATDVAFGNSEAVNSKSSRKSDRADSFSWCGCQVVVEG
jgi:hypothetical protein